jgi:hypothetical protein
MRSSTPVVRPKRLGPANLEFGTDVKKAITANMAISTEGIVIATSQPAIPSDTPSGICTTSLCSTLEGGYNSATPSRSSMMCDSR